ncbi:MAG: carboxypeptidase-like regulatory domain-containing protein [Petrimonas sp.]|jgi:hypothetical protein
MKLKDYIQGKRYGEEANRLEREAMNDPFLQDAIDGFDSVEGDHFSMIEKLEKQFASQPKRIDKRVWMWAAAAVLILLIGIPFLLRKPDLKDVQVASSESLKQEEAAMLLPEKDTVLVADNLEKKSKAVFVAPTKEELTKQKETVVIQEENEKIQVEKMQVTTKEPEKELAQVTIKEPVSEKLQGQVTGVAVLSKKEDKPSQNIRIRGIGTTSSTHKLVSGRLIDESGEPLIGGTVTLKGTKIGTVSDMDGNFKISIPKNEEGVLIASYVGMKNAETPLKENLGDIVMKADDELLSEVVVVAFGTQRKESVVGSIPTFGEVEFKKYFKENYDKNICADKPISVKVEFFVNNLGQPGSIVIKENSCPELEVEIKRLLLGSPKWSKTNQKVILNLTLNE